jgi:hypothetical protein
MDYNLEYHRELERKQNMLADEIETLNMKASKNKDDILKLQYKTTAILAITLLTLLLLLPQAAPALLAFIKLLVGV